MRIILGPLVVLAALVGLTACHEIPDGTTVRMGFAHDHNTGPEVAGLNEDKLPACAGASTKWVISTTRTVQNCRFVGSHIEVTAPNVVLRNLVIWGNAALLVSNRSTGLVIENSIIRARPGSVAVGGSGEPCSAAVGYGNYTLRRVEIAGCADGIKVRGVVQVFSSYFHNTYKGCGSSGCTHNDTVQKNDNDTLSSLTFRGNAAYLDPCTSNRHFQMKNMRNTAIDIRNNFFYGSHGIMNSDGTAGNNRGWISGNTYAGLHTSGPFSSRSDGGGMAPGLYTGPGVDVDRSGNRFENGVAAPSGGVSKPYRCVTG